MWYFATSPAHCSPSNLSAKVSLQRWGKCGDSAHPAACSRPVAFLATCGSTTMSQLCGINCIWTVEPALLQRLPCSGQMACHNPLHFRQMNECTGFPPCQNAHGFPRAQSMAPKETASLSIQHVTLEPQQSRKLLWAESLSLLHPIPFFACCLEAFSFLWLAQPLNKILGFCSRWGSSLRSIP